MNTETRKSGTLRTNKAWGIWVRSFRERLRMTQKEFGELVDLSMGYICRIEKHGWVPAFHQLEKMSERISVEKLELLKIAGYI